MPEGRAVTNSAGTRRTGPSSPDAREGVSFQGDFYVKALVMLVRQKRVSGGSFASPMRRLHQVLATRIASRFFPARSASVIPTR